MSDIFPCEGKTGLPYALRPFNPESERNYVIATWERILRKNAPYSAMSNPTFKEQIKDNYILKYVEQGHIIIACSQEDPNLILGFIVCSFENDMMLVHFIYTGHPYRNEGIGGKLLELALPEDHTGKFYYTCTVSSLKKFTSGYPCSFRFI